jgi:hypothetical protein
MSMDAKSRLILALLMSSVMVCMVTLLVTFLDLGLRPDFLIQWAKAYFIAWPVAAATAFIWGFRARLRILCFPHVRSQRRRAGHHCATIDVAGT